MDNRFNEILTSIRDSVIIVILVATFAKLGLDISWALLLLAVPPITIIIAILDFVVRNLRNI